jgi:hypothetical protein
VNTERAVISEAIVTIVDGIVDSVWDTPETGFTRLDRERVLKRPNHVRSALNVIAIILVLL